MPWKEIKVSELRKEFIEEYSKEKYSFAKLCQQFGISRPTGYKWLDRHKTEGDDGLYDRKRTPQHQPRATPGEVVKCTVSIKSKFPTWGPKKVLTYLKKHYLIDKYPCVTTVENILKRNGLVKERKLRLRLAERTSPLIECHRPNDTWCTDFKGWSLTSDHRKIGPYTLMDADSRFLISCVQLDADNADHVWAVLERCFLEYGLPYRIRSDNGPPFATIAPGRLSVLSIKLVKAGIIPEWTEPGHPEQNGRQERMHLTLQSECIASDLSFDEQVLKLNEFREYYNFIRPHEAIDQQCPGEVYIASNREWDGKLRSPEYPRGYKIGKVRGCGKMNWSGGEVYVSRVFSGEPIGICESEEGFIAYYGTIKLGKINGNTLDFERRSSRKGR